MEAMSNSHLMYLLKTFLAEHRRVQINIAVDDKRMQILKKIQANTLDYTCRYCQARAIFQKNFPTCLKQAGRPLLPWECAF